MKFFFSLLKIIFSMFEIDDELEVNFVGMIFCFGVNVKVDEWILDFGVLDYMIF